MGVTKMTGLLDVSIVIPTFNRPDRLARALHSVFETHGALVIEVIVVDDGSPDAAAVEAVVHGADPAGRTVRMLRQANLGPAVARNAGASASAADLSSSLMMTAFSLRDAWTSILGCTGPRHRTTC